jgi:hypothetical protein
MQLRPGSIFSAAAIRLWSANRNGFESWNTRRNRARPFAGSPRALTGNPVELVA